MDWVASIVIVVLITLFYLPRFFDAYEHYRQAKQRARSLAKGWCPSCYAVLRRRGKHAKGCPDRALKFGSR